MKGIRRRNAIGKRESVARALTIGLATTVIGGVIAGVILLLIETDEPPPRGVLSGPVSGPTRGGSPALEPTGPTSSGPTEQPSATTSPSPEISAESDTPIGSVLHTGETWRTGSKEIRLVRYWFDGSCDENETNEGILIDFDLRNTSSVVTVNRFSTSYFTIVDNRGRNLPVGGWGDIICNYSIEQDDDCRDFDFQLGPGEVLRPLANCAAYGGYREMSSTIATWTDLGDPLLTQITVTIHGLVGIDGASWIIDIDH